MHFYCRESVISSGGRQLNEDRILVLPTLAVAIDGATQVLPDAPLPSSSEGTWIADLVVRELIEKTTANGTPVALLRELSKKIDGELANLEWPKDRVPPVCSICILSLIECTIELAILGDVSLVYRSSGQTIRVFNNRFLTNERNAFPGNSNPDQTEQRAQTVGVIDRRRGYILGLDGAGVLSRSPASMPSAIGGTIRPEPGDVFLLATDGFMRLLDVYDIVSSTDELFSRATAPGGLATLLGELRRFESTRTDCIGTRKRSDDAAATIVEVVQ